MKKVLLVLLSLLLICGCSKKEESDPVVNDAHLNITTADMTGYTSMSGVTETKFEEVTLTEALRMFDEGLTGMIYFGYPGCPFCNQAVPVLNQAAIDTENTIYYVNLMSDEGNTQEAFDKTVENIKSVLKEEDGEPVFYVPLVIAIRNGEIVGDHTSLIEDYDINGGNMNEDQQKELEDIYLAMFKKLQ